MKWYDSDVIPATSGAFGGCKWALYDLVMDYFKEHELCREKDRYSNKHPYFEGNTFHLWATFRKTKGAYRYELMHKCEHFCRDYGKVYIQKFLYERYRGSLEKAILCTETFEELWQQLLDYHNERKIRYMAKKKDEIEIVKETGMVNLKTPQSHGGVANLLKVLTKTMEKQGSDITTIAKVQYSVCKQAGIYIPDEFLTDVAVMLEQ